MPAARPTEALEMERDDMTGSYIEEVEKLIDQPAPDLAALQAENARLRDALELALNYWDENLEAGYGPVAWAAIARAALEKPTP